MMKPFAVGEVSQRPLSAVGTVGGSLLSVSEGPWVSASMAFRLDAGPSIPAVSVLAAATDPLLGRRSLWNAHRRSPFGEMQDLCASAPHVGHPCASALCRDAFPTPSPASTRASVRCVLVGLLPVIVFGVSLMAT